jgi:hypothetical protein
MSIYWEIDGESSGKLHTHERENVFPLNIKFVFNSKCDKINSVECKYCRSAYGLSRMLTRFKVVLFLKRWLVAIALITFQL